MLLKSAVILILSSLIISAQERENFPNFSEKNLPDATISKPEFYKGEGLWGLINGGADLFLEYGFDELLHQKILWNEINFNIEVYRMNNSEAAFGILSLLRHKCAKEDTLTDYICITRFQTQAAVGKYYLNISNDKGTNTAKDLTVDLFSMLLKQIEEPLLSLPSIFNKELFISDKNRVKFISGEIALQNGFNKWYDLLSNYSAFKLYLLPKINDKGFLNIALIEFESEAEADKFIDQNSYCTDEVSRVINPLSPNKIIFVETNLPEEDWKEIM
jgi:hypothetical protein